MTEVTVKTDHKWKKFKYRYEVPEEVMEDRFKHLLENGGEDDWIDGYFQYRGWWYHVSDFFMFEGNNPLRAMGWHAFHADSYFSGVVIRTHIDAEEYMIGTFYS